MKHTIEKKDNNTAVINITVEHGEFDKGLEAAYKKIRNRISIPGFRRGKATRKTIEKLYGVQIFFEDAINHCIPFAYQSFLDEEKGLDIVSKPQYDLKDDVVVTKDGFEFTATVATKPPVTLGEYKHVKIELKKEEVTDEVIQAAIDAELDKNARIVPVDENDTARKGDTCVIDYEGFVDGTAFEGGKGSAHPLELGSNSFIPGFEDQLIGAKAGSDIEIKVTFPENYHGKDLSGKDAVFKCHVNEIKRKERPPFDDDFVQDISEYNTVSEYKDNLKKKLTAEYEDEFTKKKEDLAVAKATENATVEIPELMIETQTDNLLEQHFNTIKGYGLDVQKYMEITGMSIENMRGIMREEAEKRCKVSLVLEAISKAENYVVTQEEMDERIEEMAKQYNLELEQVREVMNATNGETLKQEIALSKAVKMITDGAELVEPKEENK